MHPDMEKLQELINLKAKEQDMLKRLYESTKALHDRFGDEWTLNDAIAKIKEELNEFIVELGYVGYAVSEGNNPKAVDVQHAFEELIDVLVTMFSCLIRLNISTDTARFYLEHSIDYVIEKNGNKTHETHERVNGMIIRKANNGN